MSTIKPPDSTKYYVDSNHLVPVFQDMIVQRPHIDHKRILSVSGQSGIGKTALLKKFISVCSHESKTTPAVYLDVWDPTATYFGVVPELLKVIVDSLSPSSLEFPSFQLTYRRYKELYRATWQRRARQNHFPPPPLGQDNILFLANVDQEITQNFLNDIDMGDRRERVVIMFDHLEWRPSLHVWLRDFALSLSSPIHSSRVLLVLACWTPIENDWRANWPTLDNAFESCHLTLLDEKALANVVRKYQLALLAANSQLLANKITSIAFRMLPRIAQHSYQEGFFIRRVAFSNPEVSEINEQSRGLPILAVGVAHSLLVGQASPLGGERANGLPEERATLRWIMHHIPETLQTMLSASAALRWFDTPLLRDVLVGADPFITGEDFEVHYSELLLHPFVLGRAVGNDVMDTARWRVQDRIQAFSVDESDPVLIRRWRKNALNHLSRRLRSIPPGNNDDVEERDQLRRDRLYYRFVVEESRGLLSFRVWAERLVQERRVPELRILLEEISHYHSSRLSSLWIEYYRARLEMLTDSYVGAEELLTRVSVGDYPNDSEPRLRAYASCDLGEIYKGSLRLTQDGGQERVRATLDHCEEISNSSDQSLIDGKLVQLYSHRRGLYVQSNQWPDAVGALAKQLHYFWRHGDSYHAAETKCLAKGTYALTGDLYRALRERKQIRRLMLRVPTRKSLLVRQAEEASWVLLDAGYFTDAESDVRGALDVAKSIGDSVRVALFLRELAQVLCMQGRFREAEDSLKKRSELNVGRDPVATGVRGIIRIREGNYSDAIELLSECWGEKTRGGDHLGIPELAYRIGLAYELVGDPTRALDYYLKPTTDTVNCPYGWMQRHYLECGALVGRVRIGYVKKPWDPESLSKADELARRFEYNDHLASLNLVQGHAVWDQAIKNDSEFKRAEVLRFYKQALVHALRYNRYLLDEILSGPSLTIGLPPILETCEKMPDGRSMLAELRQWWLDGTNDLSDLVSGAEARRLELVPSRVSRARKGFRLTDEENLARQRETAGHDSVGHLPDVVTQIGKVLASLTVPS